MSDATRGIYKHFYVSGERPTIAELKLYGIAINIPDSMLYTLNELGQPVALPLSKDLVVTRYLGYKVPLTGFVPDDVPDHVKEGKVKNLAEIFTHIYYSRPEPTADSVLRKGEHYQSMMHTAPLDTVFALKRYIVGGRPKAELVDEHGSSTVVNMPSDWDDGRNNVLMTSADYRTRIVSQYGRATNSLDKARVYAHRLPVDLDDSDVELVFHAQSVNPDVRMMLLKVLMISRRTNLALTNSLGYQHKPLAITVIKS